MGNSAPAADELAVVSGIDFLPHSLGPRDTSGNHCGVNKIGDNHGKKATRSCGIWRYVQNCIYALVSANTFIYDRRQTLGHDRTWDEGSRHPQYLQG
ncbi:MAG: hypothetical protein M1472_04870, partial [Planctomycetes bacterium]|nr:hypothetical protein [Planctomycetota bacterium]